MADGSRASCAAASAGVPCTGRAQPLPQTRVRWRRSVPSLSILQDIYYSSCKKDGYRSRLPPETTIYTAQKFLHVYTWLACSSGVL